MIDEIITKANTKDGYDKEAYKQRKKEQRPTLPGPPLKGGSRNKTK